MKNLTRIEPELELNKELAEHNLQWLAKANNHSIEDYGQMIRLLIHKVNELTNEVNRIKSIDK